MEEELEAGESISGAHGVVVSPPLRKSKKKVKQRRLLNRRHDKAACSIALNLLSAMRRVWDSVRAFGGMFNAPAATPAGDDVQGRRREGRRDGSGERSPQSKEDLPHRKSGVCPRHLGASSPDTACLCISTSRPSFDSGCTHRCTLTQWMNSSMRSSWA